MNIILEKIEGEIPFNYFLLMFEKEIYKKSSKICSTKIADDDDLYILTKEEQYQVFESSFYEILIKYLKLTDNKEIIVFPENSIDLCKLILSDLENGPYTYSLLTSLQHIIARYLEVLGKGCPTIMFDNDDKKEKSFRVVYDKSQRINTFDSTNMSLEEQTDMMIKVLKNTMENNIELMPYARYESRTDI